jgi:mRNA interferase RelE/StbE
VNIQWTPAAAALARRYLHDQDGMRAIGAAVAASAGDPYPPEAFHRGRYHRLRVGPYRVMYVIDDDLITIERVDRVADQKPPSG